MSRVRLAVIGCHGFFAAADEFARRHPRYQKDGRTDVPHILMAAAMEGYTEINSLNLAACFAVLERRAQGKLSRLEAAGDEPVI